MPKQPCYKIQLWRALRIKGFEEELVVAAFYPAMIDGHQVNLNGTGWEYFINKFHSLGGYRICRK